MGGLIQRGDVRWYRFARPDRKRPVVVLTRDSAIDYLGELTVAPVTSTVRGIPSEVVLTAHDGLRQTCAVNLDHVQTVSRDRIGPRISVLSPPKMEELREALLFSLGFD